MKKRSFWKTRTAGSIKAIHPETGRLIEVDYQRDAKIRFDVRKEVERQAGLLSWYLKLRDLAKDAYREASYVVHVASEDLDKEVRETLDKVTETAAKLAVKRDQRMREAYRVRMDAESMLQHLESAVEAIKEKGWMLRLLNGDNRSERVANKDSF